MPKCSCGVVPGDCYDACGARESKISDLIRERDEARAEAAALKEAYAQIRRHLEFDYESGYACIPIREIPMIELDAAIDAAKGSGK